MLDRTHPPIAPFTMTEPLILRPFPNGGWSIEQPVGERGVIPVALGAYSNAEDMLRALRDALVRAEDATHG